MSHLSFPSPLGDITLFEYQDALVALDWGRVDGGEETSLLATARQQLDDYFDGKLRRFSLPLAPDGSAFQKKVWTAIERIPYGQVSSYGSLAHEVDSGPRAIGGACGRNPIPIIVPCHRVLGSGGSLGGYSGLDGLETKRFLLSLEGWRKS
ncbi:methylated-DNA--[protein]-cysteine S-methyltransferase [Telmatospirillum sp.]|uniref:methylated-DNA--[protein]-cysteine S-methyltransferase n=1 Tax=Telmatospirillum sp. TaxID=2079197 RepID=UPI002848B8AB|nr:methylated-DNA--[protein]-cysteine S-methyltransferase [Telmatospirillum sp.]MDR3439602.1 methylated-DNA--[protein]-cysteine S-methyltransferase [Telmatospirillum sp.]